MRTRFPLRDLVPLVVLAFAALLHALPASAESSIDALAGQWRGQVRNGEADAGEARMAVAQRGSGFTFTWAMPGSAPFEASFEPDEHRAGVYKVSGGGLLSLLGRQRDGDPLDGKPLVWARVEQAMLVVYSLTIDEDGGYRLGRLAYRREADGVTAELMTRSSVAEPQMLTAQLAPVRP
jgi:hypothetical protein